MFGSQKNPDKKYIFYETVFVTLNKYTQSQKIIGRSEITDAILTLFEPWGTTKKGQILENMVEIASFL